MIYFWYISIVFYSEDDSEFQFPSIKKNVYDIITEKINENFNKIQQKELEMFKLPKLFNIDDFHTKYKYYCRLCK